MTWNERKFVNDVLAQNVKDVLAQNVNDVMLDTPTRPYDKRDITHTVGVDRRNRPASTVYTANKKECHSW